MRGGRRSIRVREEGGLNECYLSGRTVVGRWPNCYCNYVPGSAKSILWNGKNSLFRL